MRILFLLFFVAATVNACAQKEDEIINAKEIERIETILASDEMRGRRAGTADIDRAADFIAGEFKKARVQPVKGNSFLQEFSMVRPQLTGLKVEIDGEEISPKDVIVNTFDKEVKIDEKSGYEIQYIKAGESLRVRLEGILNAKKNMVVFVDTSFSRSFPRLSAFNGQAFTSDEEKHNTVVYVLGHYQPKEFKIKADHILNETKYSNVVGILPGKTRKNEYVIFSAHYDHLGIARQPQNGDSIYNGANDDAAGTTAVMMLANYFKKINNNERTLVFAAFTAEEIGGFGSQYFSKQFNPSQVVAMFNIEMIGTESKWGKRSAYITGYEKTNMGEILQSNLKSSAFTFHPDPYPTENLFYRSDNATLAKLGVPAHTISTAKMDGEPNYHRVSDEVSALNLDNMAEIIKAIALSSRSIVNGKDTPTRVKREN
jgi:Zn-dependent M28 family amino/carboxypeptidase